MSKSLAVPSPKILEMKKASENLGLDCELVLDACYPKTPWLKEGILSVSKNEAKNQIIKKIAKELVEIRNAVGSG